MSLIEQAQQALMTFTTNQFAAPALIASVIAPIAGQIPSRIVSAFDWIKQRLTYSVSFHFSDAVFIDLSNWLSNHPEYLKFVTREKVESLKKISEHYYEATDQDNNWFFRPAYGSFLLKPKGYPLFMLLRTKEEQKVASLPVPADTLHIYTAIWNKKKLHKLIKEISDIRNQNKEPIIKMWSYNDFTESQPVTSFVNESLLPDDLLEIESEIDKFLDSKELYKRKNMRWNLGVMLHSKPGCGKSYFISYLAKKYGLDIHYLTYKESMNPLTVLSSAGKRSIVLMDDIDTWGIKKRDINKKTITEPLIGYDEDGEEVFLGENEVVVEERKMIHDKPADNKEQEFFSSALLGELLNALDGVASPEGLIIIATTNNLDAIDPALLRPGRMDLVREIGYLKPELIIKHWLNFFDEPLENAVRYKCNQSLPVSKSQEILKRNMKSKQKAMEELGIVNK